MQRLLQPLMPFEAPPHRLARFGELLRRHRPLILGVQWAIVVVYLGLVSVPAFLELPPADGRILQNLTLFAQFLFWGIWWPFVIVSVMLVGRAWCGLLCPEGALTEFASRFGRVRPLPRWIKWGGWPFVAFILTTVYGQLVSVYEYAGAALLVLGGSTLGAIVVGLAYGRNKRVWCRYLCPVNGVFGLLARLAPVHFRVDREAWKASAVPPHPIHCPPMVHIKAMSGGVDCHMCGQCSGHKGAIWLEARPAGQEIVQLSAHEANPWEAALLVFGMIGVAVGAFQWSASPWFVAAKVASAEWLVQHEWWWALGTEAPWWLLTHYPQASDVFTWLDGLLILGYIGATAVLLGGWITLWLAFAGRALGEGARLHALRLAYSLVPLAGFGIFLGLSALTVSMLKAEGLAFPWLDAARATLLVVAAGWSLWLGWQVSGRISRLRPRRTLALLALAMAIAAPVAAWAALFFLW